MMLFFHNSNTNTTHKTIYSLFSIFLFLFLIYLIYKTSLFVYNSSAKISCTETPQTVTFQKPDQIHYAQTIQMLQEKNKSIKDTINSYQRSHGREKSDLAKTLQTLSSERRSLLVTSMREDPTSTLSYILPKNYRAVLHSLTENCVEIESVQQGTVEIFHADSFILHKSIIIHSLTMPDKTSITLHTSKDLISKLRPDAKIEVKGYQLNHQLLLDGSKKDAITILSNPSSYLIKEAEAAISSSMGNQRAATILVNFKNTTPPLITRAEIDSTVFIDADNYYRENSYGKTWITGTVFPAINTSSVRYYSADFDSPPCSLTNFYIQRLAFLADNDIDYTQYSHLIIFAPFGQCGFEGAAAFGKRPILTLDGYVNLSIIFINTTYIDTSTPSDRSGVVEHELGHTLGVDHASFIDCGANVLSVSRFNRDCSVDEYGDIYDVMGGAFTQGHMNAPHKEHVGWLDSSQVKLVTTSGTYSIEPLETASSGVKALKIIRGFTGQLLPPRAGVDYLYIEYRQPLGYDSYFAILNRNVYTGALLHILLSPIKTGLLDASPPADSYTSALTLGNSLTDPYSKVTITVTDINPSSLTVNITFPCIPQAGTCPAPTGLLPSLPSPYPTISNQVSCDRENLPCLGEAYDWCQQGNPTSLCQDYVCALNADGTEAYCVPNLLLYSTSECVAYGCSFVQEYGQCGGDLHADCDGTPDGVANGNEEVKVKEYSCPDGTTRYLTTNLGSSAACSPTPTSAPFPTSPPPSSMPAPSAQTSFPTTAYIARIPSGLPLYEPTGEPTSFVGNIVNFAIILLASIAVIAAIIWLLTGGIKWITSGGDKVALESSRIHTVSVIAGLILLIFTFVIISVVLSTFGTRSLSQISFTIPSLK